MAQQLGVADLLVRCLEREGVTAVFGIPGEEKIYFADALARSPIRRVLVRHEQAPSFMAQIYGGHRRPGGHGLRPRLLRTPPRRPQRLRVPPAR
ncbi:MAG TPA: thiamine pyrophosphate-binding protein [Streptosporangiaceae bacterium]|nr:thiamine pyrophosphate-binding protein [Streptosporangiaceae bacterium]